MDALVGLLKDTFTSLPLLQVFAGAAMMIVIAYMVMRAQGDKAHGAVPAPAPASLSDVPAIFAHGPREMIDLWREMRDLGRRQLEELSAIRECVRVIRGEAERQTESIERIEREQEAENRARGRIRP